MLVFILLKIEHLEQPHIEQTLLTTGQSRMTGDTDPGLLPVHVHEPALQTAACSTEHLENKTTHKKGSARRTNLLIHHFKKPNI